MSADTPPADIPINSRLDTKSTAARQVDEGLKFDKRTAAKPNPTN